MSVTQEFKDYLKDEFFKVFDIRTATHDEFCAFLDKAFSVWTGDEGEIYGSEEVSNLEGNAWFSGYQDGLEAATERHNAL